ncbi:MAG: thiamine phosphate synthase [Terriglobales bacterium]
MHYRSRHLARRSVTSLWPVAAKYACASLFPGDDTPIGNAYTLMFAMMLPRLYAILDASCFPHANAMFGSAEELAGAGVTLLQYRNKSGSARQILEHARELKRLVGERMRLIMNDRADLCLAAGFDGLHVGQDDLSPEAARRIIGADAQGATRWLGVSAHNPEQLVEAGRTSADYLAIGPVFTTSSKVNPDPVVGLEGVRRARELTRKPLVAIGGITRANALSVIEAGADAVAVISDLLRDPRKSAEEFLRVLR